LFGVWIFIFGDAGATFDTAGVELDTAGVDEAEHVPGVFAKLPFLICTQYIWPVAWSVISMPFVIDAVCVSIVEVFTSVNIARVAVI